MASRSDTGLLRALTALALCLVAGCSSGGTAHQSTKTLWLCQPSDTTDPCHISLASTAVHADGTLTQQPAAAQRQSVDCFYVYPTVSQAQTTNAPLTVTEAERQTARAQVALFSSVCRIYAPMYRQITVHGLFTGQYDDPSARALAHADVVAAWHAYLMANPGRRFVLIGHSQGTLELLRLMQEEIDPNPALRARLVSAMLIGGMVKVPTGATVGGDLKHIPLCTSNRENSCVITYNSFSAAPPAESLFGRPDPSRHLSAACTNPAMLGGVGPLQPYFPAGPYVRPETTIGAASAVTTDFATYPGYLTAQCMHRNGFVWLQVSVRTIAGDHRSPTLPTILGPRWGLHIIDVNLALGNLVSLVRSETS